MDEDRNTPATKGDVQELQELLKAAIHDVNERIDMLHSEMQHMNRDLVEGMRDIQTETLKALYGFIETTNIKLHDGEVSDSSLRQRLSVAVESRLTDLERRLNLPPQQ